MMRNMKGSFEEKSYMELTFLALVYSWKNTTGVKIKEGNISIKGGIFKFGPPKKTVQIKQNEDLCSDHLKCPLNILWSLKA